MKKISVLFMTLVMVLFASCNKPGSEKEEEKDSWTTKDAIEALKNNPSDRQIIKAIDQYMKNVQSLAVKEDEKLFNETVDLVIAGGNVNSESDEVLDKFKSVKGHIMANKQLYAVAEKIEEAAEAKMRGGAAYEEVPQEVMMEQAPYEEEEVEEVAVEAHMAAEPAM